jgi:hypothetical protein
MGTFLLLVRKQTAADGCSCYVRHENVTISVGSGVDWKGLGYLASILSVFLLGAIAWPTPGEPRWHMPVLLLGMATSICGMGFRYYSHLLQMRELRKTEAEARRR